MTWVEKLEYASKHGGVMLNETEAYQLAVYLMSLLRKVGK
jgi:hypothetical protein